MTDVEADPATAFAELDTRRSSLASTTDMWTEACSRMLVPLTITGPQKVVHGHVTMRQHDGIRACTLQGTAHVASRSEQDTVGGSDYIKLCLGLGGHMALRQHDRTHALSRGDVVVYDTADPYDAGSALPFGILLLLIPRSALGLSRDQIAMKAAQPLQSDALPQLREAMLTSARGDGFLATGVLADIAARVVRDTPAFRLPARTDHDRIVAAAQRHVEARLADPTLDAAALAALTGVSRRRLYEAFAAELGPVATYVRERRIARARDLLLDPEHVGESIAHIAAAVGLPDPTHFSRVFHRTHGLSPRAYRARGVAEPSVPWSPRTEGRTL
ncbi:helix-turn-helix domain-containing protein [Mumia sp. ZJ1417]|uniref:helix-turn-helix domain-containing protein n=1 Tax=unclassified Mumia TaxID=2621872 RepID=UPI0014247AD2|nr:MULTISPECIES: helix-turn-helix domain-containing protein [unclassified Mumia]QMW65540.1 helix-turn-helix domain-containing protein [Mumia sp. ZJ1417]